MDKEALKELDSIILHRIGHEIEHALESPTNINRVVGEAMRHIGSLLDMSSGSYLPIRHDEILTEPKKLSDDSTDAVLLITRSISNDNAFLVMANCKTIEDKRVFDLCAYKPDNFNLNKTRFIKLPTEIGTEIIRQLNILVKSDGVILLQAAVVKEYFKTEEKLDNVELSASVPPTGVPAGLPPVTEESLL